MKISDSQPPRDIKDTARTNSVQDKVVNLKAGNRTDVDPVKERVILSQKAKDIKEIREILRNTPDVREDRVAILKKKIESGEYSVKGKEVADQMLREFLLEDLLKRQKKP